MLKSKCQMENGVSHDNNKNILGFTEIEPTEKFGPGKLYKIGVVEVEIYENLPDEKPPLARIRAPGASLALSYVADVKPSGDGGMLIDFGRKGEKVHSSLSINRVGDIAFIYSPPPPPMGISASGKTRRVGDVEFTQSTIEIEGTPEGVRVQVKGIVDGSPRPVNAKVRNSPLMFFLIEENPKDLKHPVYHEVWAVKGPRQELQKAKLVKGTEIEAVLYRHTFETELIGGGKEVMTRHNLSKILYVKKPSPKEPKI
jgi:hypothetical protein